MLAVIENTADPGVPLLPIAGRPLILRQLQWLRACGFDQVAIEVPAGPEGEAVAACVHGDALGWDVVTVVVTGRADAVEVVRRAGFAADLPVLALPGEILGGGDLAEVYVLASSFSADDLEQARRADLEVQLPPPSFLHSDQDGGSFRLLNGAPAVGRAIHVAGWGTHIRCAADAIVFGAAALQGHAAELGVLVHASERSPGVWVARGGRIQAGAEVVAPVLIGAGAIVRSGARIGPRVFLGERAVIERGAVLEETLVEPHTIVGEKVVAKRAHVMARGMRSAEAGGTFLEIDDPLILAHRSSAAGGYGLPVRIAVISAAVVAAGLALAALVSGS